MYSPPPGFADLQGDADRVPPPGPPFVTVTVEGAELLVARPGPRALAALAEMARASADGQLEHLHTFVGDHMAPETGGIPELMRGMVEGRYPDDMLGQVSRAIATMGTARSYTAVVSLANLAGHHWRALRNKLMCSGIADPMALPTMHAVLDVIETMAVEATVDGTPKGKRKLEEFYDAIYRPERRAKKGGPVDDGWRPPPAGFSEEDIAEVRRLSGVGHGEQVS